MVGSTIPLKERATRWLPSRLAVPDGLRSYFRYHGILSPAVRLLRDVDFFSKSMVVAMAFTAPLAYLTVLQVRAEWQQFQNFAGAKQTLQVLRAVNNLSAVVSDQRNDFVQAVIKGEYLSDGRRETAIEARFHDFQIAMGPDNAIDPATRMMLDRLKQQYAKVAAPRSGTLIEQIQLRSEFIRSAQLLSSAALQGSPLAQIGDGQMIEEVRLGARWLPEVTENLSIFIRRGTRLRSVPEPSLVQARQYAQGRQAVDLSMDESLGAALRLRALGQSTFASELVSVLERCNVLVAQIDKQVNDADAGTEVTRNLGLLTVATERLNLLGEQAFTTIGTRLATMEASWRVHALTLVAMVVLGLLFALYLLYSFYHVMRGGMTQIQREVERMSRGDLSGRPVPRGADDVGQTLLALHTSLAKLADLFAVFRRGVGSVSHASSVVASASQDLARSSQHSGEASQAVEVGIGHIMDHLEHNDELVQHAVTFSREMTTDSGRSRRAMAKLSQRIELLQSRSREIGKIVGLIDGIAFQTNLLSLNASVEASRAGAAGKGFGVVAQEVRQLAHRVSEAGQQIQRIVSTSINEIEQGHEIARHTQEAVTSTERNAREVDAQLTKLADLKHSGHETATHMVGILAELRKTNDGNARLVAQLATAATELRSQSLKLSEQSAHFKLN